MSEYLNRAQYAKHLGCSPQMITKHDKAGRLIFNDDGLVDVRRSDALIVTTLDSRGGNHASGGGSKVSYLEAKTKEANARATKAEIEAAEMAGLLARIDDIEKTAFDLARRAQEQILSIPDRLAASLANETDAVKIHDLLTRELTRITQELSA